MLGGMCNYEGSKYIQVCYFYLFLHTLRALLFAGI